LLSCDYSDSWSVWFSETVIITVLKSVAKERLVKTKDFSVSYDYRDNWSVWFSETVIFIVLKSVAKKRLVKIKDFYVAVITVIIGVCGSVRLLYLLC
jgi:hypothetical protein